MHREPKESTIVKQVVDALNATRKVWAFKVHGGPMQTAGVPDVIACAEGRFIALEVKRPSTRSHVSELQRATLNDISWAEGVAAVVTSPSEALDVVDQVLKPFDE